MEKFAAEFPPASDGEENAVEMRMDDAMKFFETFLGEGAYPRETYTALLMEAGYTFRFSADHGETVWLVRP